MTWKTFGYRLGGHVLLAAAGWVGLAVVLEFFLPGSMTSFYHLPMIALGVLLAFIGYSLLDPERHL